MPFDTCPVTDRMIAEYALGPDRTRLTPEEIARVEEHMAVCPQCSRDCDLYVAAANNPGVRANAPDAEEIHVRGAQSAMARVTADIAAETQKKARADALRQWRKSTVLVAAGMAAATVLLFVWLGPAPPDPEVVEIQVPGPGLLAEGLSGEERALALSETARARADLSPLGASGVSLPPSEALERLALAREGIGGESSAYRNAALAELALLHERLLERVRGTPEEAGAALALSRAYLAAGMAAEWEIAFARYADLSGRRAQEAARAGRQAPRDADRAEQAAKAAAYLDEILHHHGAGWFQTAIRMSDRLMAQFPRTAQAWEGLTVAARCYLANGQPSGSIACYRRIMEGCPDERFAREAAKALLKMYLYADQLDNAVEQAQQARKRFQDNDFRAYSLLMEGTAHERKGESGNAAAMRAYREAYAAKSGSPYAGQANEKLEALRSALLKEMELDPL